MDKSKQAFPVPHVTHVSGDNEPVYFQGMTLREYAAVAAMQGLLANPKVGPEDYTAQGMQRFYKTIAHDCVKHADALLARLEESK